MKNEYSNTDSSPLAKQFLYWKGQMKCDNPDKFCETEIVVICIPNRSFCVDGLHWVALCHNPERIWGTFYAYVPLFVTRKVFSLKKWNVRRGESSFEATQITKEKAFEHLVNWLPENPYLENEVLLFFGKSKPETKEVQ